MRVRRPPPRGLARSIRASRECAALGASRRATPFTLLAGAALLAACTSPGSLDPGDGGMARGDPDGRGAPDADLRPPAVAPIVIDCGGQDIPDEPKIDCGIRIEDGHGALVHAGPIGIERRGRSSLAFPKAQYSVELRDDAGLDASVDLFGMGGEADWILNGMYIDRALFRTKLMFDTFQSFGDAARWAPESRYAEVTLDGEWLGIYLLSERVERDDDRVDLAADVAEVGASFIVKQDDADGFTEVDIAHGNWQLVYPDEDRATASQVAGVRAALADWTDAVAGDGDLFDRVDLDNAVDFVILQELIKNVDAYYLSLHVWRDVGGKLHFTPWDLDLGFGQPSYNEGDQIEGWITYRPQMIEAMNDDPRFRDRLVERWAELRAGPLDGDAIATRAAALREIFADEVEANFERWPIDEIEFFQPGLLYEVHSYADEIERVTAWLPARLAWIDDNIADY